MYQEWESLHHNLERELEELCHLFFFRFNMCSLRMGFVMGNILYIYTVGIYIYLYFQCFLMDFTSSLQISGLSRHISGCCLFGVEGPGMLFKRRRTYYILQDFWTALTERYERIRDCLLKSFEKACHRLFSCTKDIYVR